MSLLSWWQSAQRDTCRREKKLWLTECSRTSQSSLLFICASFESNTENNKKNRAKIQQPLWIIFSFPFNHIPWERERTKRLTEISIVWCCHWMILHFNIAVIKKWTVNRSLWLRRVNNKKRFDIGIWWHSELMKIYEYLNGLASSSMTFRFFRCGVFPNVHWHRSQMAVRIHILSMMKLLGRNITSNMDNVPELRAM